MKLSGCGLPTNLKFIIKKKGEVKQEMNIDTDKSYKIVNDLEPETEYTAEIQGKNVKRSRKKFQTTKISKKTERNVYIHIKKLPYCTTAHNSSGKACFTICYSATLFVHRQLKEWTGN